MNEKEKEYNSRSYGIASVCRPCRTSLISFSQTCGYDLRFLSACCVVGDGPVMRQVVTRKIS